MTADGRWDLIRRRVQSNLNIWKRLYIPPDVIVSVMIISRQIKTCRLTGRLPTERGRFDAKIP
jgi:hypothetical protein